MGEVSLSVLLANRSDQIALKQTQNEFARKQLGDSPYFFTIGMEYMSAQNIEKAAYFFEKALVIDPSFQQAINNMGVVEERRGKFDKARIRYETALKLEPKKPQALLNLYALLEARFSKGEARDLLREHLITYPRDETIRLQLVDDLFADSQISEGHALLQTGLKIVPDSASINFRLGVLYRETQNIPLAQRHLLAAAQSKGRGPDLRAIQADSFSTLALMALQQDQTVDYSDHLRNALLNKSGHRSARLLAAAVALHRIALPRQYLTWRCLSIYQAQNVSRLPNG